MFLLFLLGLVQFVDEGELTAVIVHPQYRAAVIASCHQTALSEEQTGEVGQVGVADGGHPERGGEG